MSGALGQPPGPGPSTNTDELKQEIRKLSDNIAEQEGALKEAEKEALGEARKANPNELLLKMLSSTIDRYQESIANNRRDHVKLLEMLEDRSRVASMHALGYGTPPESETPEHCSGKRCSQFHSLQPAKSPKPGDTSWRFKARVTNATEAFRFRKAVYGIAEEHVAHKGSISYTIENLPLGCTSLLDIDLLFKSEDRADDFGTALLQLVERYSNERIKLVADPVVSMDIGAKRGDRVHKRDYNPTESPVRCKSIKAPQSSCGTSRLDEEIIVQECLSTPDMLSPGSNAQWCHIIPGENLKDGRNRLVMDVKLHEMYDAKNSEGDAGVPTLSVFCREEHIPLKDSPDYQPVSLQVVFDNERMAAVGHILLRHHTSVEGSARQFQVTIQKRNARSFVMEFLNVRHCMNKDKNYHLRDVRDPLATLQGAPPAEADLADLEEEEEEEEEGGH